MGCNFQLYPVGAPKAQKLSQTQKLRENLMVGGRARGKVVMVVVVVVCSTQSGQLWG